MLRHRLSVVVLLAAMMIGSVYSAERPAAPGMGGMFIFGDWVVKTTFGERQFESILSFTRGAEGAWIGQWISFWGVNDLKDVRFEDGTLTFTQVMPGPDGQAMTSTFAGKIEEGRLVGVLKNNRGEMPMAGQRRRRASRAVGDWELKYTIADRDVTAGLVIRDNETGELSGQWKSTFGESVISDLKYDRGELTFKRTSKFGDQQMESVFEGRLGRDGLTGTIKSERGEIPVTGALRGGDLVGTWMLDMASEQRNYKQRLVVNPDMTGLYGSMPVKEVTLQEGVAKFMLTMEFGDQKSEMKFDGKIVDGKLVGEMKTSFGATKVVGTKVVRAFTRLGQQQ